MADEHEERIQRICLALSDIPAGVPARLDTVKKAGVPVLAWGNFLTIALNFVILAFVIFVMIKPMNRLKKEVPAAFHPQ
jgi:large conductance mechanosensitive channel